MAEQKAEATTIAEALLVLVKRLDDPRRGNGGRARVGELLLKEMPKKTKSDVDGQVTRLLKGQLPGDEYQRALRTVLDVDASTFERLHDGTALEQIRSKRLGL